MTGALTLSATPVELGELALPVPLAVVEAVVEASDPLLVALGAAEAVRDAICSSSSSWPPLKPEGRLVSASFAALAKRSMVLSPEVLCIRSDLHLQEHTKLS